MIEKQEHTQVEMGSSRSFGIVFCIVFLLIGLYPLIKGESVRIWSLAIAGAFLAVSLIAPGVLQPLNRLWFKFGMLLAKIVNPLVMLLIYLITIVPIGFAIRAVGRDPLKRQLGTDEKSYWIVRTPPGPEPDSLTEQF